MSAPECRRCGQGVSAHLIFITTTPAHLGRAEFDSMPDAGFYCPPLYDPCSVCGEHFTEDEYEVRHSAEDGSDVHEGCCEQCREVA